MAVNCSVGPEKDSPSSVLCQCSKCSQLPNHLSLSSNEETNPAAHFRIAIHCGLIRKVSVQSIIYKDNLNNVSIMFAKNETANQDFVMVKLDQWVPFGR